MGKRRSFMIRPSRGGPRSCSGKTMKIPFIHLCSGKYAKFHRSLCPTLGTFMSFTTADYPGTPAVNQPGIRDQKNVIETIERGAGPF